MLDRKTILKPVTISFRPWVIILFVLCPPMWVLVGGALFAVPWSSPNAPAWVQAVGSIGAILIAVWIASRQATLVREQAAAQAVLAATAKLQQEREFIARLTNIVLEVRSMMSISAAYAGRSHAIARSAYTLREGLAMLQSIDVFKVADGQIARDVTIVRTCLVFAIQENDAYGANRSTRKVQARILHLNAMRTYERQINDAVGRVESRMKLHGITYQEGKHQSWL